MEQNKYLETKNISVGYHKKVLISGIEIEVHSGEIVTLIGPNGAGKSTILKSIIRELELLGGAVHIGGSDMQQMDRKEMAKKMAILMTKKPSPELMTCHDVVASGRYPYTGAMGILSKDDKSMVDEAIRLVHAEEIAGQDFSEISDGQMQRILLARCICQEPEIIILDEPTSYLDIRHKLELLHLLKNLAREKKIAVLMSLHEIDLAQKVSDKIICVSGDKIDRIGLPEEIFSSDYISKLYGMTIGNYLPVTGSLELAKIAGEPKVFVIGGGGAGIPIYRKLQREGIPFACGILWENDVEYEVANALAVEVISVKAFTNMSQQQYDRALAIMKKCERVISVTKEFSELNRFNEKLWNVAVQEDKI